MKYTPTPDFHLPRKIERLQIIVYYNYTKEKETGCNLEIKYSNFPSDQKDKAVLLSQENGGVLSCHFCLVYTKKQHAEVLKREGGFVIPASDDTLIICRKNRGNMYETWLPQRS